MSRELGAWGEEQAARWLRRKGYTIVERNYACRFGEIDLIARRRGVIAAYLEKLTVDHVTLTGIEGEPLETTEVGETETRP